MCKLIIAVGLIFAIFGYKKTWYPSWAFLFNTLISIYIGIMTAPQIVDKIPFIREHLNDFAYSAGILAAAVIVFVIAQFLSSRFLTSACHVSFPKILDNAGAAVLNFAAGLVLAGFLLFLTTIIPLGDYPTAKFLTKISQISDEAGVVVRSSCNFIHSVSFHASTIGVDRQMGKILTDWKSPETELDTKPTNPDPNNIEVAEELTLTTSEITHKER